MRADGIFAGMGVIGLLLFTLCFFGAIGLTFYGLYLAFSASIVLGIIALIVEPSPFIFGLVMFAFDKNIPQAIMTWINS